MDVCKAALFTTLCVVALTFPAVAECRCFSCGKWTAEIDAASGAIIRLEWDGREVSANPGGRPTIGLSAPERAEASVAASATDASGEAHGMTADVLAAPAKELPLALSGISFDEAAGELSLAFESGPWRVSERLVFGAAGNPDRLSRRACFWHAGSAALKFKGFRHSLFMPLHGEYFLPGGFFTDLRWREDNRPGWPSLDWSRRKGRVADFSACVNDRVKFAFQELEPGTTAMFFCDSRLDGAGLAVSRKSDALSIDWRIGAQGWCEPGQTQRLAAVWLEMAEKPCERMLDENAPELLRDLGFVPPPTRPEWVADAAIYGIETEPFRREVLSDIPDTVGPRMRQLGLDTCWYRPCEASTGRYAPIDYRLIEPKIGSADDYRETTRRMHGLGIRVLQDMVPHGGGQLGFFLRGQSCSMQGMTERGDVLDGWSADFADPRWRDYMRGTCELYAGDFGVDGFRVDAIYGSKTLRNWRRRGWPCRAPGIVPFGDWNAASARPIHPEYWAQSLAIDGGEMPPLAYERASLASAWGGLRMVEAMRDGATNGCRDAALLLECGELPFTAAGDLTYDRDIQSLWFKLRALPPRDFVKALGTWLHDEEKVDAPGCIRMRYMETGDGESWPYRNWFGIEADKAVRALCAFTHGVPMFFENFTEGEGEFIASLMRMRRGIPALRRGKPDYLGVKCDAPEVFAFARRHESGDAIVAINFSSDSQTARVSDGDWQFEVALPPFGCAVAADGRVLRPEPRDGASQGGGMEVATHICSADGAIGDARLETVRLGDDTRQLIARSSEPCWLAVSFPSATHWELDTAEGMLADLMPENTVPRAGDVVKYTGKRRETKDPSCVWCGDHVPLDPNRPELRVFGDGGATLSVESRCASHRLYRDWDGRTLLTYLVRFGGEYGDFIATVRDGAERKPSAFGALRKAPCGVEYRNVSTGWKIRFGGRGVVLLRSNGVVMDGIGLGRTDLVAEKGMAGGGPFAVALCDPESRVRIEEGGDSVTFVFTGELRAPYALGRNRLRLETRHVFFPSGRMETDYALTPSGSAAVKPSVRLAGDGVSHEFFAATALPLVPRRTYRFGLVSAESGMEWRDCDTAAATAAPPLELDGGFEKRSSIVSAEDGHRVAHFEKTFDDRLPWTGVNATAVGLGFGVGGSAGVRMAWCNPEFRQEVGPDEMVPGKYRFSFDARGSLMKEPRIREWSDRVSPFHPFLKEYTLLTASLAYFDEEGRRKVLRQERKIDKEFDWRRENFVFEVPERGHAPEVSISLFNEYAGETFIDNIDFAQCREE